MPSGPVWFMILSTAITGLLLVYAVRTHSSQRSFFLILATFCSFLYSFGYLLEITAPTLEAAFTGVRVQKMGSPFLVLLNYLFMRDVYGEKRFGTRGYCLLFALPVFNLITAQAFPLVRLHYTRIRYFWDGRIANCQGDLGPVGVLAIAYHFVLAALTLWRIAKHLRGEKGARRRQSLCLLASVLVPLFVNIYHTSSYDRLRLDLNPFAVAVSQVLLLYSVHRQNLLSVVPLARAQAIESMADAFIVCGGDFRFLDANQSAKRLFPELGALSLGEEISWAAQLRHGEELCLEADGGTRFYQIAKTDIAQGGRCGGSVCIVLHDITDKEKQLKALYDKATIDPMMRIYTRAAFCDLAEFILGSDTARDCSHALLMIDLDHFKRINDTYGHPCGDAVMGAVAAAIRDSLRGGDLVGRYGGDEITVLMENLSLTPLLAVVEELRAAVGRTVVACQGRELTTSISVGVAYFPPGEARPLEEMFVRADRALYKAKNGGRNRACLYEEDPLPPVF